MSFTANVSGFQQIEELQTRIKAAGNGGLDRKFRRNVERAGKPVVAHLQAAAMGVKVTSSKQGKGRPKKSTGLRARVASAIRITQTSKGIRIVVSARRFGPHGVTLPRYLDAELPKWKRWRVPVFWHDLSSAPPTRVVQQTGGPFFFTTIREHRPAFEKAVDDVAAETKREFLLS